MRHHGTVDQDGDWNQAAREAAWGAAKGAAKWGVVFALGAGVAQVYAPAYRRLTIQFKTYIQMSGMILGGYLEADRRMSQYTKWLRNQKRLERDMEIWKRYEDSYEERGTPGVGAESRVRGPEEGR